MFQVIALKTRTLRAVGLVALAAAYATPATVAAPESEGHRAPPVARVAAFSPNDPGRGSGWANVQWNFTGPWGVGARTAWTNLVAAGRPGGAGVVVAVVDTGVAYKSTKRRRRSPDLLPSQFVRGYDFVDEDRSPLDGYGHGTHVASTIAERTNNGIGLTGLAYGVKIMPIRVLDNIGEGDVGRIARGVRWAVRHGADIVNLSLEFDSDVGAHEVRSLISAIAYAKRKRVLVVGATGNDGDDVVAYPARDPYVLGVGATTEHGCLSIFSNSGANTDLVAPGGGPDAALPQPNCHPNGPDGRNIAQVTLTGRNLRRFGIPYDYAGTSMAVPHVSATAALVIASGVIGTNPTPEQIIQRLQTTARDLGAPGPDPYYGWGLLDAAAATSPLR